MTQLIFALLFLPFLLLLLLLLLGNLAELFIVPSTFTFQKPSVIVWQWYSRVFELKYHAQDMFEARGTVVYSTIGRTDGYFQWIQSIRIKSMFVNQFRVVIPTTMKIVSDDYSVLSCSVHVMYVLAKSTGTLYRYRSGIEQLDSYSKYHPLFKIPSCLLQGFSSS